MVPSTPGPSSVGAPDARTHPVCVFVRYFVEVPYPFAAVEQALLDAPHETIGSQAQQADDRSQRLMAEVGFPVSGHRVGKTVDVTFGEPARLEFKTLLPMTWTPVGARAVLPVLQGDLEVAQLGATMTQLALSGRYRPPFGALGRTADRALMHRVAEATVKDFLDRVAARIAVLIGPPSEASSS